MTSTYLPPPPTAPRIIYADDNLLAVDKPSGLLSVPGRGPDKQDCLLSRIRLGYPEALMVHRLDMGTSGLLLFALNTETQRALSRLFETRQVNKTYIACVRGIPDPAQGKIDLPLSADWPRRPRQKVDLQAGKAAYTEYQVINTSDDLGQARLELRPRTGRSHQLRVHLAAIGYPILGDELYADSDTQRLADRLLLHAACLSFEHPVSGERLEIHCAAPF